MIKFSFSNNCWLYTLFEHIRLCGEEHCGECLLPRTLPCSGSGWLLHQLYHQKLPQRGSYRKSRCGDCKLFLRRFRHFGSKHKLKCHQVWSRSRNTRLLFRMDRSNHRWGTSFPFKVVTLKLFLQGHLYMGGHYSQLYSRPEVTVRGTRHAGGLVGFADALYVNSSFSFLYSRARVSGTSYVGGLFGRFSLRPDIVAMLNQSYASSPIEGSTSVGNIIGEYSVPSGSYLSLQKVYYTSYSALPAVGVSSGSINGTFSVFTCSNLYREIFTQFDQNTVWGGDRLLSEFPYSFGKCNCTSGCPSMY